jgi:hypothetical protein
MAFDPAPIQERISYPLVRTWVNWFSAVADRLGIVRQDGTIEPVTLADADAENNSIYYSSDAGKLVYKDSGGTVNDLY